MNEYARGLRHGWEDCARHILEILDEKSSDAEKLALIRSTAQAFNWTDTGSGPGVGS